MKIWIPTLRSGSGADVYFQSLAAQLTDAGHDVTLSWFPQRYEPAPFPLRRVAPPPGTEIVHSNSWHGFAFKRAGIPLVVTLHHCVHDPAFRAFSSLAQTIYHRSLIRRYEQWSLAAAALAIGVSRYTLDRYRERFDLPRSVMIYNGVDTGFFTPEVPSSSRNSGPFRLLFVGNNSRRKGFDLLPEVMRRLGDGYLLRYTSENRRQPGRLPPNMMNIGRLSREELLAEYRQCDAVLYPSRYEGFGYVVAEGMACGKAVITCGGTSIDELLQACGDDLPRADGSVASLVAVVREMATRPRIAHETESAQACIAREFSTGAQTRQIVEAYESVTDLPGMAS